VLEHILEIAEVLRWVEGSDGDRRPVCTLDLESVARYTQRKR